MARVLIVDKDTAARNRLAITLEARGHDVLCAASGAAGMEMLRGATPDVVVAEAGESHADFQQIIRQSEQLQRQPLFFKSPALVHDGPPQQVESADIASDVLSDFCVEIESQLTSDETTAAPEAAAMERFSQIQKQIARLETAQSLATGDELAALRLTNNARLTASVVHDANQPLAAIKNLSWACQRLIADMDSEIAEQLSDYHDEISAAASRTGAMIRKLAHFVIGGEGGIQTISIQDLLEETLELEAIEAERANIQLRRVYCEPSATVHVDRAKMQAVLLSRVQDSVSGLVFSAPDSPFVEVAVECDERDCLVTVRDNRTRDGGENDGIYTLGFTVTESDRRRMSRVCRYILESQRGDVVTDVVTAEGAVFAFRLPRYQGNKDA